MNPLFNSNPKSAVSDVPAANAKNHAGGRAYKLSSAVSLAKYCVCGTFNDTYQAGAEEQLDKVLALCDDVDDETIARIAIYGRTQASMKDTPALLVARLATTNVALCKQVFPRVIDSPKMLRNFVQIIRSGKVCRKSLGTAPKRLVQNYLNGLTDEQLFRANVGNSPSLADIIKLTHPSPGDNKAREALYAYILGKEPKNHDKDYLLPLIREFEAFKKDMSKDIPNVPFQMLTALPLTKEHWSKIAERASWTQVRMNLNTFERHGVLEDQRIVDLLAEKLSNPEEVRRSRVMPYQLFTTFMNVSTMPQKIKNALQAAMEVAIDNVPCLEGNVYVGVDVSGSMTHAVTGNRGSVTTKSRYVDIAALIAAAIVRKNKDAVILPFDTEVRAMNINAHDSIMTNAQKLASIRGGGTDVSSPIRYLNDRKLKASLVIIVSDCESWKAYAGKRYGKSTPLMHEWNELVKTNPGSKLVNIDISPSDTAQISTTANTMLVGGFSDAVFDVLSSFLRQDYDANEYWMTMVNSIKL